MLYNDIYNLKIADEYMKLIFKKLILPFISI